MSSDVRTGAGTDVSLTNVELPGLGVPIRYDATTGTGAAIRVSGLCANEAYVFAIGAFDAAGRPLGPIGPTGPEIDALVPLPLSPLILWPQERLLRLVQLTTRKRMRRAILTREKVAALKSS